MEVFSIVIVTCTIVFFICFVCGYCCKRSSRGAVLGPPLTVTTTHVTAASVEPPYPTNMPQSMPQPISQPVGSPGIGFSNYAGGSQTTSYPPPSTAASVEPPYPTNMPQPMPQPISQPVGSPGIGFSNYAGGSQATSYPPPSTVEPPYPTNMPQSMPQPISQSVGSPGIGLSNYAGGSQTTSYPPPSTGNLTPYPPGQIAPPPSYSEAISQSEVTLSAVSEHYIKQAPYTI